MAHPPIISSQDNSEIIADIADRLVYFEENPILGDNMAALPPRPTPMTHEERIAFYKALFG